MYFLYWGARIDRAGKIKARTRLVFECQMGKYAHGTK